MRSNWMLVTLVMAACGPTLSSSAERAAQTDPWLQEIESGCHPLIMAHECRSFRDALFRTQQEAPPDRAAPSPPRAGGQEGAARRVSLEERERILSQYLATIEERLSNCRCELAASRPSSQEER